MRPFRLARIAAEAEGVRLRGMLARIVARVIFGCIALLFATGTVVFAHIAAWYELRMGLDQTYLATAGLLGGGDLLLALILGFLASRSSPSRVEIEALEVRRKAIEGLGSTLSLSQMALPLLRLLSGFGRRRRA
jgi:hypothetical protein